MRKQWLWVSAITLLLAACGIDQPPTKPTEPPYNGPVVEIGGVEPRYEPVNPASLQDYTANGRTWHIEQNPSRFSETGLASWYGKEASGNRTSIGELFDPEALSAAHPTLPLPSYVRVTNLANGRQIVVRVNDRGPYVQGRIIDLSRAAGDRLNISNNTPVRVDYINVAPDGTLSGPGTRGTTVAKQSFALPERPSLSSGGVTHSATPVNKSVVAYSPPPSAETTVPPVASRQPLFVGHSGNQVTSNETVHSSATSPSTPARTIKKYRIQVGALSEKTRAQQWLEQLKSQFNVPGSITVNGSLYRVQLGPFTGYEQAIALQQRLASEAHQHTFIIAESGGM